jgi:hypothetical protein
MLSTRFIDGNSVVHSWHPSAVSRPVAKLSNFIIFYELLSMTFIAKFGFLIEHTLRHFKQFCFMSLRNTFLYFVNNTKLVHRRQPYPTWWMYLQSYKVAGHGCNLLKLRAKLHFNGHAIGLMLRQLAVFFFLL